MNIIIDKMEIDRRKMFGIVVYLHINGIPIKVGIEVTQHPHDFVACIPKPVVLNKLNNKSTIKVSTKTFKIIDNKIITINFVIES